MVSGIVVHTGLDVVEHRTLEEIRRVRHCSHQLMYDVVAEVEQVHITEPHDAGLGCLLARENGDERFGFLRGADNRDQSRRGQFEGQSGDRPGRHVVEGQRTFGVPDGPGLDRRFGLQHRQHPFGAGNRTVPEGAEVGTQCVQRPHHELGESDDRDQFAEADLPFDCHQTCRDSHSHNEQRGDHLHHADVGALRSGSADCTDARPTAGHPVSPAGLGFGTQSLDDPQSGDQICGRARCVAGEFLFVLGPRPQRSTRQVENPQEGRRPEKDRQSERPRDEQQDGARHDDRGELPDGEDCDEHSARQSHHVGGGDVEGDARQSCRAGHPPRVEKTIGDPHPELVLHQTVRVHRQTLTEPPGVRQQEEHSGQCDNPGDE